MKNNLSRLLNSQFTKIIFLVLFLLTPASLFADTADSLITTEVTWSSDINLTSSVVISSGGKLTIEAGVRVGFNYVDLNVDGIGDLSITVRDGGSLVIKGSPKNPVVFEPIGSLPPAGSERRHWNGIILENADTGKDTLRYFEIWNSRNGLTIERPLTAAGVSLYDTDSTAIVVHSFDSTSAVTLCGITVQDLGGGGVTGTALIIEQPNTTLHYATIDTITGDGIYCNADNIQLNWVSITYAETGVLNAELSAATTLSNSSVSYCSKSGIFNHEGGISLYNCTISNNTFNGVVNSSGTLEASYSLISNNTERGVLIGGDARTIIENITNTANGDYGCETVKNNIPFDTDVLTGPFETNTSEISFTYSNIYDNKGHTDSVQLYNGNDTLPQLNFTRNWWGKASGINFLVEMVEPATIDYSNWKLDGVYADAVSDLTPPESIAFSYPLDGQYIIENTGVTVTWNSVGDFSSIIFESTNPVIADTIPNCGSYTFSAASGTTNLTLSEYKDGSPSTTITVESTTLLQLVKPEDGDTLFGRLNDTIIWVAPASVDTVALEYSTDGGSSWHIIAEEVQASDELLIYNVENAAADYSGGLLRISDAGDPAVFDTNFVRIVPTPPAYEESDSSWMYTETSIELAVFAGDLKLYKNVYAPDTSNAANALISGAEDLYVGVFYRDGSDFSCAGYSYVKNFDGALSHIDTVTIFAYGDDPLTSQKDGFGTGDTIFFKLWRLPWDNDSTMTAVNEADSTIETLIFTNTGSSSIDHLRFWSGVDSDPIYYKDSVIIPMENNWRLISSYVIPDTADLSWANNSVTQSSILSKPTSYGQGFKVDPNNFIILKDGKEGIYWLVNYNAAGPDSIVVDNLNNTWNYQKGYFLKMNAPDTLVLQGNRIKPQNELLTFDTGWNIIPYFRTTPMNIDQALNSIIAHIHIIKDSNGKVFWPIYSINEIGTLKPGQGYFTQFLQPVQYRYPINSPPSVNKKPKKSPEPERYALNYNSDNSMVICILESALEGIAEPGDEIGAFNEKGELTGSALFQGGNTALVIWGRESIDHEKRGMLPGENFTLKLFNGSEETLLRNPTFVEGNGFYKNQGSAVIQAVEYSGDIIPDQYSLLQNYPNPFNPETIITFGLPVSSKVKITVFSILGEKVRELKLGTLSAGYHEIVLRAGKLPSGIYFYRLEANEFTAVKKMMILK